MARKIRGGNKDGGLTRRIFDGPSKAPYGGSMDFEMPGFHTKPDGSPAVEMNKQAKRDAISKSAPKVPKSTDASFFKHTIKDK